MNEIADNVIEKLITSDTNYVCSVDTCINIHVLDDVIQIQDNRFENLPLGTYHLVALKTNYTTDHTDVDLIRDETVLVNFNLYPRQGQVNGGYVGYLYNEATRLPVPGATVRILPTSLEATSDTYGKFTFDDILAGDYQVEISAAGYATLTKDVHIVAGQTTVDYTIFLTPL